MAGVVGLKDNEEVTGPFLTFLTDSRPVGRGLSQHASVPVRAQQVRTERWDSNGHGETQGGRGWIDARGAAGGSGAQ